MEKTINKLKEDLENTTSKLKRILRSTNELETDLDIYKSKLREKDFEIDQLTESYNQTLEELGITCSELDGLKDFSIESTQRLRDQLSEITQELEVARNKTISMRSGTINKEKPEKPSLKNSMAGQSALNMVDLLLSDLSSKLKLNKCDL